MSFADTSGDLPSVFPVRIRLRFREPEVTLFAKAVRKPGTTQMEAYIQAYIQPPLLRFHMLSIYIEIIFPPTCLLQSNITIVIFN